MESPEPRGEGRGGDGKEKKKMSLGRDCGNGNGRGRGRSREKMRDPHGKRRDGSRGRRRERGESSRDAERRGSDRKHKEDSRRGLRKMEKKEDNMRGFWCSVPQCRLNCRHWGIGPQTNREADFSDGVQKRKREYKVFEQERDELDAQLRARKRMRKEEILKRVTARIKGYLADAVKEHLVEETMLDFSQDKKSFQRDWSRDVTKERREDKMSNDEKLMMEVMGFSSFTGKKANRKEESEVEKKEERLTAGCPRGRDRKRATEIWEAPMSGTWQPTRGSGLPSWDKSKLKKEENPPNWVEPPHPKVDLSLFPFKIHFDHEVPVPPVTPLEKKEELLLAKEIPEDDLVVVLFPRGYVRTTRRGLKESKKAREKEERAMEEHFVQKRCSFRSEKGRRDGGKFNQEPVSHTRGFGKRKEQRERSRERRYKSRSRDSSTYKRSEERRYKSRSGDSSTCKRRERGDREERRGNSKDRKKPSSSSGKERSRGKD